MMEFPKIEIDPDSLGSRLVRENDSLTKATRSYYNRLRRLENQVRMHVFNECDCRSREECMMRLYRLIPIEARRQK